MGELLLHREGPDEGEDDAGERPEVRLPPRGRTPEARPAPASGRPATDESALDRRPLDATFGAATERAAGAPLEHSLVPAAEALEPEPAARGQGASAAAAEVDARFEVLRPLGTGATGVVVLARDRRTGEHVALKRLRNAAPDRVERLRREAAAIAALAHPGIVRLRELLHVERDGAEEVALVLEAVDGPDLERLVARDGPLPLERALEVGIAVADALAHAHAAGVVHRDVKPSNVLLAPDGTPRVADFGLALATTDPLGLTVTGAALGTVDYMAPEQRTRPHDVDARADVYGLGATLYRLVTGRPPRVLRERDLAAPAREVVLRCLEEDPRERWPDMRTLGAALGAALARARRDRSGFLEPLERLAQEDARACARAARDEAASRLEVAARGLAALGLATTEAARRLRERIEHGASVDDEVGRLALAARDHPRARAPGGAALLADAHAILAAALAPVALERTGRQALRLLERASREPAGPSASARLAAALGALVEEGSVPAATLPAAAAASAGVEAVLDLALEALRAAAQAASVEAWPGAEARWRRALDALAQALPEHAARVARGRLALELERLARRPPPPPDEAPPA